jgi:hypothetical protein
MILVIDNFCVLRLSSVGVLSDACLMFYGMLRIQLFLQPQFVPRREHSLTYENCLCGLSA